MEEVEERIQSNFGQNRQESSQTLGGDAWAGKHSLPAGLLAALHSHLTPSSHQPPQLLMLNRSSVNNRIIYFSIMLLQSLHFYRKENYRVLKWGLSRAPSAAHQGWALAVPVPLQLLTCPQSRQKRCRSHGSQQLLCLSLQQEQSCVIMASAPPFFFCKVFCWCLLKVFQWVSGFYTGNMYTIAMSCRAVTCGHKGAFSLGLLVSNSLGDGVGNCKLDQWVSLFLSTTHGPPAAEEYFCLQLIHQFVVWGSPDTGLSENGATAMCKLFQWSSGLGFFCSSFALIKKKWSLRLTWTRRGIPNTTESWQSWQPTQCSTEE